MAPPAAKLRKRKNKAKKGDDDFEVIDMFGTEAKNGQSDFDMPLPPMMSKEAPVTADDSSDEGEKEEAMPKRKGSKKHGGEEVAMPKKVKKEQGIKTLPLILLILLTGSTLLPAVIYVGDMASNYLGNNNVLGQMGYRLGIGAVPRKRVLSFYEKHNPEKISEVPTILSKHYGEYPKLIKKLERKYQDYGYFHGWEEDEAPMVMVRDSLEEAYSYWIQHVWNRYAPVQLRTAARNVKYNFTKIYKKGTKIWKKQIWPVLEPYIGVPDERTAAKQKRMDAEEAKRRRAEQAGPGRRRKNKDFRDDVED
uniref:Uncharacterized protein n=1 Tax=Amphora coffeiformis TaxID=265554 RepID=A0A7S3P3J9_9STRA|mmetsp:Transcript_13306/g.25221  ORF Transcript_13306/g.25221 Transcript_13306/m.25221 type:complete len:307 (-) Transcript_13306:725-1645(-)|eukprot:scaffold1893_cov220-Amphora_coffeaeformis.AAC.20